MFDREQETTMKTTILTLTLVALCGAAFAQNDNPFGGTGSITSQTEFKREIRNANDTGVEGTEFFKLTYECTWELVRTDDTDWERKVDCVLKCNGKKHIKHSDCDTSCDTPCPVHVHRFSFAGHTNYLTTAMREAERDADNLVVQAGGDPHSANWTSYYTRSLSNAKRMSERLRQYAVNCWNTEPCSTSRRFYGVRRWEFRVTGKLTETGYYMSRGVKTPYAPRNRGTHTKVVANVFLPEDDPISTGTSWNCKCKPVPIKDPGTGGEEIEDGWVPHIWGGYLIWEDDGDDVELPNDKVQLLITGVDLNRVHIEVKNNSDENITVVIGGGLVLVANDGATQDMTVMVQTKFTVPAHSTQAVDARAACIEMNKLEPTSKTVYTIAKDQNQALLDMASLTTASRFRGPTDQARVWIITDHATYDQIKEHLLPSPDPGQYLNALYDVAKANGADLTSPDFKKCFDPALLVSTMAKEKAVDWFVETLDRTNPAAFTELANKHTSEFADLLGDKADKDDVGSIAHLLKELLSCSSPQGRMAGLTLLLKAVPAARREEIAKDGGLDPVIVSTQSEDPKEQTQALEVIDVYSHKPAAGEVDKLAALGASDAVKKKAADVAKKLGGAD